MGTVGPLNEKFLSFIRQKQNKTLVCHVINCLCAVPKAAVLLAPSQCAPDCGCVKLPKSYFSGKRTQSRERNFISCVTT